MHENASLTPLDNHLATSVESWLECDDALLNCSVALTSYALRQGHSCLSLESAFATEPYCTFLNTRNINITSAEQWQQQLQPLTIGPQNNAPVVLENSRLYLRRYWNFEQEIAEFIQQRKTTEISFSSQQLALAKETLAQLFPGDSQTSSWQKIACANSLLSSFSVVTGGPGTGKTYTLTRILALLLMVSETPLKIRLAAPTGKAAQRMAESIAKAKSELNLDLLTKAAIPDAAETVHRLLGFTNQPDNIRHNQNNPVRADVIVVDEASMVDLPMMTRLMRATADACRLILLGDANQLPSVSAGSVLADIVAEAQNKFSPQRLNALVKLGITPPESRNASNETENDQVTKLQAGQRFSSDSDIGKLASSVLSGDVASAQQLIAANAATQPGNLPNFRRALKQWHEQYFRHISESENLGQAYQRLSVFRILTANREGPRGVNAINQQFESWLNPTVKKFYRGQPILITENQYGLKLFNGDIGLVWPNDEGNLVAWFPQDAENFQAFQLNRLPTTETCYAMTIHKTQGSEFDHIAIVLPEHETPLLSRELLYTAVTRAKKSISVFAEQQIIGYAIQRPVARWSGLSTLIKQETS